MVAEKIKEVRENSDWRLWGTIAVIVTVMGGYVNWSSNQTKQHIDLRLEPLFVSVAENTEARKKGGRYTDADAARDMAQLRHEINTCKNGRKDEDARLHIRVDQLFQKMFEFHSAHAHDMMMKGKE